ncbi:uncharacterized transposon-derived protein F54H12.3 [Nephila pilipes]|uniref:Uncharacterized transposon-derived protein F54H12.3 n=1 Tax=Nephila pilipes TaxID=299642 RepID=A0A8X6TTV2_NEPPI|nr:uncharacterized transposon-derived protein F54H12.3 [Nephila pilipes]
MAIIPEELATTYIPKIPDNGLQDMENQILNHLHDAKYPDDAKAKLFSQLLLKYQHVANEPKLLLRVSIIELKEIIQNEFSKNDIKEDAVLRDIVLSVPSNFRKFIPPIVEKLKTRNYFLNEYGELVKDNEIVKNTNAIDLFSYLIRNLKKGYEPNGFSVFWKGINEIKIPSRWIGNQKLVRNLEFNTNVEDDQNKIDIAPLEQSITPREKKSLKQSEKKKMKKLLESEYYDFSNPTSFL